MVANDRRNVFSSSLLSRLCTVSLANGVEVIGSHGPFYFFRQLFVAAVQVLLPGNEGLYFPFVVFYKWWLAFLRMMK